MPSWNIHISHAERLLDDGFADACGIGDTNVFLFGNVVPDIYVGYVVPNVTHKIPYKDTHLADPKYVPVPDASGFYARYVRGKEPSDLALGAWIHLLCDHYYNLRTNEYIARIGVQPGERTRIRKQADFNAFGRSLSICRVPEATPRLVDACAGFAQYPIEEQDVRETIGVFEEIVRDNEANREEGNHKYSLLDAPFFAHTYAEVDDVLHKALRLHAKGGDPTVYGRP